MHLLAEILNEPIGATMEKLTHALNFSCVLIWALLAAAGCSTPPKMKVKTRPIAG
jgi:hypothetical protein